MKITVEISGMIGIAIGIAIVGQVAIMIGMIGEITGGLIGVGTVTEIIRGTMIDGSPHLLLPHVVPRLTALLEHTLAPIAAPKKSDVGDARITVGRMD